MRLFWLYYIILSMFTFVTLNFSWAFDIRVDLCIVFPGWCRRFTGSSVADKCFVCDLYMLFIILLFPLVLDCTFMFLWAPRRLREDLTAVCDVLVAETAFPLCSALLFRRVYCCLNVVPNVYFASTYYLCEILTANFLLCNCTFWLSWQLAA